MRVLRFALVAVTLQATAQAGTVTVETNILGPTPAVVGYDSGHFYPASNTGDWWRYSGVTGARLFISPTDIEPVDELPPWGDGVTNQASFLSRKALVRSDPWNTNYFNWPFVTNRFATYVLTGSDYIAVNYALSTLQQLGVQALIDSTAMTAKFTNVVAWADQWELWHYYYEEAFYLGSQFNVQRYQMYNEPDDGGPTGTNYLTRLQLASDAIQSALADVNTMYGKSLMPMMLAPVTAGSVTSTYSTWGELVVTNRHVNYLGQSNPDFWLMQKYDYHQYGGSPPSPSTFGSNLAYLEGQLSASMAPETPLPTTISEFNVYDGSEFNSLTTTLDTPANYSAFGAIAVNLIQNGINELYCFKISQTVGAGYIAKNGTHYVDNTNAPYNIGGITKGGEVWRLMNKGFAPGRQRLNYQTDSQTSALNLLASYDPAAQRYYLLSVNNNAAAVALTVNMSAWGIPTNNQVLVEAVNESCYGAGLMFTNVGFGLSVSATQGSNSVWLFTVPAQPQQAAQTILASANAQVADGANKNVNYTSSTNLLVENNSTNANYRSAALLQFQLPAFNPANLQLALLTLSASSANGAATVQAYVYGLLTNSWSENSLTWANAPNLAQGIPPGTAFTNNFVLGAGSSAFLLGQLVAGSVPAQYTIDVTSFLQNATSTNVSFLLAREVRFLGDVQDGDGVSIVSREGSPSAGPRLQLVFNGAPSIVTQPQSQTVSAGSEVTFSVAALGLLPLSYQWWFNTAVIPGATNQSYTLTNASAGDVGTYSVVVTNQLGSATSTGALLVLNTPPSITNQPQSQTVIVGQNVTFSVAASGTPPFSYQWQFNGNGIPGATASSFSLAAAQRTNAGVYSVLVMNSAGTAISDNALLSFIALDAWGDDMWGQLQFSIQATNVIAVAAGMWHSLALRADGVVLAWGDDSDGQCDVPLTLEPALAVAGGGYHSLAIQADGTVAAWGAGDYGQTNVPAGLAEVIGISAGTWHSLALRRDGTVVAWGDDSWGQSSVPGGLSNVVAVAAGGNHSLALEADGTVTAWGENTDADGNFVGQSVVPGGLTNVVAIAAGDYHSLAVQAGGTVVAWGDNSDGQCSVPAGLSNVVAVAGGGAHTLALEADGTVAAWGANWSGQCTLPSDLSEVVGLAAGEYHSLALLAGSLPVPQLLSPVRQGGRFSVLVQTLDRQNYALEFNNTIATTDWSAVATNAGNGALLQLSDPAATGAQRFYRMRQW